jgi:hypothetical protein
MSAFWLKVAAPEMGPPLFDPEKQVWEAYEDAAVPRNRSEATKFVRVCEMLDDGMAIWRGEWLYDFPKYRNLSTDDLADWKNWLNGPGLERFLWLFSHAGSENSEKIIPHFRN